MAKRSQETQGDVSIEDLLKRVSQEKDQDKVLQLVDKINLLYQEKDKRLPKQRV
jgi:hypothetical protein